MWTPCELWGVCSKYQEVCSLQDSYQGHCAHISQLIWELATAYGVDLLFEIYEVHLET